MFLINSKGEITANTAAPSYAERGAQKAWATFQAFRDSGMDDMAAARRTMEVANGAGVPVPKELINLGLGRATNALPANAESSSIRPSRSPVVPFGHGVSKIARSGDEYRRLKSS